VHWKMQAMAHRGCVLALVGKSAEAIQTISFGIDEWRLIGATVFALGPPQSGPPSATEQSQTRNDLLVAVCCDRTTRR
jgi:hypothetical protein